MLPLHQPKIDVLYFYKPSESQQELKFSLRSLSCFLGEKMGTVYIYGSLPSYIDPKKIVFIPERQDKPFVESRERSRLNRELPLTQNYLWMCDDFFIMKPISSFDLQPSYLEKIERPKPKHMSSWQKMLWRTLDFLKENGRDPLYNFETHTPCLVNRLHFASVMEPLENQVGKELYSGVCCQTLVNNFLPIKEIKQMKTSFYLNINKFNIELIKDKKFVYTSEEGFSKQFQQFLEKQFPFKSQFEKK